MEKRELRDLNARLELYVHNQRKKQQTIDSMRNTLAKQEIDFRNKIRDKEAQFNQINEKLRSENESLQYQTKAMHEELQTLEELRIYTVLLFVYCVLCCAIYCCCCCCLYDYYYYYSAKADLQQRVASSEKRVSQKESEIEGLRHQLQVFGKEMQTLRAENADIKYKYENHDNERKTLMAQFKQMKDKNANLMKESTKVELLFCFCFCLSIMSECKQFSYYFFFCRLLF